MKIPSSHLYELAAFQGVLFFVKDGRTKVRSTLLPFKQKMLFLTPISDLSLKFHCIKYFEEILAQNFLLRMFSLDAAPPQAFVRAKDKKIICTDMK